MHVLETTKKNRGFFRRKTISPAQNGVSGRRKSFFLRHTAVREEERANAGLGAERNGISLDALDHGEQTVRTRRRKIFGQPDFGIK